MNAMTSDMQTTPVPAGSVRMYWLGQAGFAFKNSAHQLIYLDPYLSDSCERLHGLKRLALPAITPGEVKADLVVLTHEHTDHLDPDTLPLIAQNNPACRFAGPAGCQEGLEKAGITADRQVILDANRRYDLGPLVVHTAPADHGDFSPTALGLVLEFDGKVRVMVSGDTSWRTQLFKPLYDLKPDVLVPVINGVYGNMNHLDAAMMVQQAKPRIAIPCHFWTFAEQGAGDPGGFLDACKRLCPDVRAMLLKPGEGLMLTPVR